ncbi:MAG: HAD-IB family hydrolase [Actinobacteria bacterium]|nr:HAD-IB family hydrolase [Actinomycetota bacterium]MCB9411391.1 HAD-IB family hydrolase [Actinomycetota bacterium]
MHQMDAAAFFDLDKTILAKSSSLAFAKPLYDGGLIGRSAVLKSAYAQFVFLTSGADHDQMEQMRAYMQALCAGWPVEQVRQIVADTLDQVVDPIVYTEALDLIAEHRAAGRDVIVISSSGTEVVEPICDRLGVDRAVGTQMAVDEDGKYTGEILFYAYGENKALAMRDLSEEYGYDLAESYAYTDSQTDLPMLEAVGHPFAVNPDDELRAIAVEREWPILDFERPEAIAAARAGRARKAGAAGGAAAAVALGVAWYARRRSRH